MTRTQARRAASVALHHHGLEGARLRQLAVDTNWVYRVDAADGRRFALRVQRPGLHDRASTDLELWWVQRLAADGLPVAGVVPDHDGNLVTEIDTGGDEAVRCVLFHWLPGSSASDEPLWFWVALGELTARLHEQAAGLVLPAGATQRRWDSVFPYESPELFDAGSPLTPGQRRTLRRGVEALDPVLHDLAHRAEPPILLHGDLHDGNVRSFRRRLSVFDFEDHLVGYPEHDLAVALYGPYYNRPDLEAVMEAMRAGYERVRPWPVADVAVLRPLFAARALGLVSYCLQMGPDYHEYVDLLTGRVAVWLMGTRPGGS